MKKLHLETYLGILLLLSVLLLSTKGIEKLKKQEELQTETESQSETVTESPKPIHTIVIDAGHGGIDPGKVGINEALEKNINLAIAQKLKACLEKENIRVVMTREADMGLYEETDSNKKQTDMAERCRVIEEADAALTVSIHQNSFTSASVSGPQVFYYDGSKEGEEAARCLQEALNTHLEIANPREMKANTSYYILKKSATPAVIAECGFLSNREEADKLATEKYQQKVAEALAEGIVKFLYKISSNK